MISGSTGKMENYLRAIESAGGTGTARYAPQGSIDGIDGLILCGGGDITPALFGAGDSGMNRGVDPVREQSDFAMIAAFVAQKKPILGICRGMQILNVALGGTILQDLGEKNQVHSGTQTGERHHPVISRHDSMFAKLYGEIFEVNSDHHQAVLRPADGFPITSRAPDGTPEGVEHESLPIIGVQWHPERLKAGSLLMRYFVRRCE